MTEVRVATADDAPGIGRVHVESWQACYRGMLPDEMLDSLSAEARAAQWGRRLGAPGYDGSVFVATDGDEIVGFASGGPARDTDDVPAVEGAGELEAIYLLPSTWRKGVGGRLHDSVVEHLTAAAFPVATLWVLEANTPARRFYERNGWSPDGTTQLYQGAPELRYRRPLG